MDKKIVIGGAALVAALMAVKAATQDISVDFDKVNMNWSNAAMLSLGIDVYLNVKNHTSVNATLDNVVGDLSYAGEKIGTVNLFQPVLLVAGTTQTIILQVQTSAPHLISDLVGAVQNAGVGVFISPIAFVGTIYTSIVNIPLSDFKIPLA